MVHIRLEPVTTAISTDTNQYITRVGALVAAITLVVLLIACFNAAGLLLGRAIWRRREITIRLSLGASRGRIVRQLLTESVLLALAANALALGVIVLLAELLPAWSPAIPVDFTPDWRVVAGTSLFASAVGVLFGLAPALHATRVDVADALKDGAATMSGRRARLQGAFVVVQVAATLVLLFVAGSLATLLAQRHRLDLGFDTSARTLAVTIDPSLARYSPARAASLLENARDRVAALPGVEAAGFTTVLPLTFPLHQAMIAQWPRPVAANERRPGDIDDGGFVVPPPVSATDPELFAALGVRVLRGRGIERGDVLGQTPVIVLGQDVADAVWPGVEPLGKQVLVRRVDARSGDPARDSIFTIVGITAPIRTVGQVDPSLSMALAARRQLPDSGRTVLVVRTRLAHDGPLAAAIRRELQALDPTLPILSVESMMDIRRRELRPMVTGSIVSAAFGGVALLLASVGVYALIAFGIGQRVREIGIRLALGAEPDRVRKEFFRRGMRLTAIGVIAGGGVAWAARRPLGGALVLGEITTAAVLVPVAVLLAVAALATWLPTRRAATIDPLVTLRQD